jgi:dTDP-4-dehydrorhamnose reductase
MKILLLGASSYVGARIYFELKDKHTVTGTYATHKLSKDFLQLDITNKDSLDAIIRRQNPDIILHVANNASSKWCAVNPDKAVELNQTATRHIVDLANQTGIKILYISTMGAINPKNLYGKTKAESEKTVRQAVSGYLILRPSLILGYSPNTVNDIPFNRLLKNLYAGKPAVYDTSWRFQPTYIRHISDVICHCIKNNIWNDTISVAVPELKTRFDTARDILTPFGIKVEPTKESNTFTFFEDKLDGLYKYSLPRYSYDQMIELIVREIKECERFKVFDYR